MKLCKLENSRKTIAILLYVLVLLLTVTLRIGGINTAHRHGIADWGPDTGRYLAQERMYIKGKFKPISKGPLYTGNPYANILFLSYLWRLADKLVIYEGGTPLDTNPILLSKIGHTFYIFLSVVTVIMLLLISNHFFHSNLIGFLSSFFFAVSPLAISLNHTIKPEPPMTCFLTISAFFILLISEKRRPLYYILAGIFAGIATSMKYNGSIVMLYLVIIHTYKSFKDMKEQRLIKKSFYSLFSPYLGLSFLLWALSFYATEPILWDNLSKGISHISQYLKVTALWGVPEKFYGKQLEVFFINIKWIPRNLKLLFQTANPYFMLLAIIGVLFSKRELFPVALKVFLLPFLLVIILFFTKHYVGEEFLFNSLPLIYIISGLGFLNIYKILSKKRFGKVLGIFMLVATIFYGLYTGFSEAAFFSIGNIQYYATSWVNSNLPGKCIFSLSNPFYSKKEYCHKNETPVLFIDSDLKKKYSPRPEDIILKYFQLEKNKSPVPQLLEHKIYIYAKKGRDFTQIPIIPRCPVPHRPVIKTHFVRFMNGVDFDPGYNSFFLTSFREYRWLLISKSKMKSISLLVINCNKPNNIQINNNMKEISLLPFEKKLLKIPLTPSFPWRSPYLYGFKVHTHQGHILLKLIDTHQNNINTDMKLSTPSHFDESFKAAYHYSFKYLAPLLEKEIPLKQVKDFKTLDPIMAAKAFEGFCVLNASPVFLERGYYICEITTQISINHKSRVHYYILSPPDILAHNSITNKDLSSYKTNLPFTYKITIPFKTNRDTLVVFMATHQGKVLENILKVTFKTNFYKMEKEKNDQKLVSQFLSSHALSLNKKIDAIDPESINSVKASRLGNIYYKNHDYKRAERWFKAACSKNPIEKTYLISLSKLYKKTGNIKNIKGIKQKLAFLKRFTYINCCFETGLVLNAYRIPSEAHVGELLPIRAYLTLPNISGNQSVFFSFEKDGNFYFGKDFSLFYAKSTGELRFIDGTIQVPKKIPIGTYNIFFTFRIPNMNYHYHLIKENKQLRIKKVLIGKIAINSK